MENNANRPIVVTAPTGRIGRQVVDGLLGRGRPVRVIARDPSRLDAAVRERVEIVQGSHAAPDVVAEAFTDAGAVFWLVPPDPRAGSVEAHVLDFTRPACEAIRRRGVERVVGVSSLGRGWTGDAGQVSAVLAMDELIEGTGVAYRALRMPGFMENMLQQAETIKNQGTFFMTLSPGRKVPACATRDIAAVASELLLDGSWSGHGGVPVLGPEDLSPDDMARIMSEVLQRPIRYRQISGADYKAVLLEHGMTDAWAQGLVDMASAVEQGIYNAEPRTPESSTPTSFRRWCEDVLKPATLT